MLTNKKTVWWRAGQSSICRIPAGYIIRNKLLCGLVGKHLNTATRQQRRCRLIVDQEAEMHPNLTFVYLPFVSQLFHVVAFLRQQLAFVSARRRSLSLSMGLACLRALFQSGGPLEIPPSTCNVWPARIPTTGPEPGAVGFVCHFVEGLAARGPKDGTRVGRARGAREPAHKINTGAARKPHAPARPEPVAVTPISHPVDAAGAEAGSSSGRARPADTHELRAPL